MNETQVIHVRDYDASRGDIYIGRAFNRGRYHFDESPWANPYRIGIDGSRDQVIAKYRDAVFVGDEPWAVWIREHVHELRGHRLACFCKEPGKDVPCHGDPLKAMAEEGASEG